MATKRETLHPEIKRLREDEGLKWREIGERMGLRRSTVCDYYSDPTGEAARARKAKNDGKCIDCGAATKNSGSKIVPERCDPCFRATLKVWTPEEIVAAIQRWADEHGGVPPTATQWKAHVPGYPAASTVTHTMGWRAAIDAAGFQAFAPGQYGRDGEYPEAIAETVELYRSGLTTVQIAERLGMSTTGVYYRLVKAGEPMRGRWPKAA